MAGKAFFDSLWFNAIMSIVSVAVLVENVINQNYIMIVIWIVIVFHFIKTTKDKKSENKR